MKRNSSTVQLLTYTKIPKMFLLVLFIILGVNGLTQNLTCVGEKGKLDWLIFETNTSNITQNHSYPQNPSRVVTISKLETVRNYTDNFSSIIKGFITVPVSGKYYFNITANERAQFYLSSNELPTNAILLVEALSTGYTEFDKNATQTNAVELTAGNYYYFEVLHREGSGSDHARVSWKTPVDSMAWNTVPGEFLYNYSCNEICNDKGTPCDDGNPQTINDREDGACNCFGTPVQLPLAVGEYGKALALYYDGIAGNDIAQLLAAKHFPLQPSRSEVFYEMQMPNRTLNDSFGTMLNACLLVPVSGNYEFRVTGNTSAELYLATSPAMDNLELITRSSGVTKVIQLNANQFYYLRLLHKENLNSEDFAALWKTPFHTDGEWKTIDGAYLYQYNLAMVCLPAGTPCDDGNSKTTNDSYNNNCECVGIPCPNGDCDQLEVFYTYDACENTGNHGTHPDDSWLSCLKSTSTNTLRGKTHWIQYDLGNTMLLGGSHVWNYNVENQTGKGFKKVVVDVSSDNTTWKEIGEFEWQQASGKNDYSGFIGPNFTGNTARYILISGLSNWNGDDCAGFSEITFAVAECPGENTPCDDNDPATINDRYGADCQCKGDATISAGFIEVDDGMKIFPNPATGWSNLVFFLSEDSFVDITIYDINGRTITKLTSYQKYAQGYHQKSIPTQQLKAGAYLVVLKTSKAVIAQKLIKLE